MALVLEDHVFRVLENQDALDQLLGEHRWDFNMDAGTVVFSSPQAGGLLGRFLSAAPQVLATCPVQLIGTESDRDNTWLWAWANAQSEVPPDLVRGVERIRDEARDEGLARFFDAGPIPRPRPQFGTELAIICTGHLGLFTCYACSHPGGLLHLAIVDPPEGVGRERDAMQAIRIIHIGISALEFDHRRAVLAYLGEPSGGEGEALEWDVGPLRLHVEFDAQGRIGRMTTHAGSPS